MDFKYPLTILEIKAEKFKNYWFINLKMTMLT